MKDGRGGKWSGAALLDGYDTNGDAMPVEAYIEAQRVRRIGHERKNPHPAPFPVELAKRCIAACPDNGVVLDPYCGSGSTLVAAAELGRPSIGIDISPAYCAMARERVAARHSQ